MAQSMEEFAHDGFLARAALTVLPEQPLLADRLVARVLADDSFYTGIKGPALERLRDEVELTFGDILRGLAGLEPLHCERARELAERAAHDGVPVASVLRIYRLGGQLLWELIAEQAELIGEEPDLEPVLEGAAALWTLTNMYSGVISQAYDDSAADRFRRSERERALLLDALFEGRLPDLPPLREVSRILDLPERGELVVVVAENPAGAAEELADIDQALRYRGFPSAWRLRSQREIGIVVIDSRARGRSLDDMREVMAAKALGRVGVGPIYRNLADSSHHVSLADLALCCLPTGSTGVALFDEHPIGTLVAHAPDVSARIVALVLGPVLTAEDSELLIETLHAWIASGGSTGRTAAGMYCHRNTVRNRLQRVEALTGRSLAEPTVVAETCLALKALSMLPTSP